MEPVFFGESVAQLYGVYHAPCAGVYSDRAVLLCYPGGHEYMRIHRAYRQLASLLNKKGVHVLRFDFLGTGDSAGGDSDISMEQWQKDISIAIEELKSLSGASTVDLVGLRLSTLLVSKVAANNNLVKRLVLWEPMLRGQQFIREMEQFMFEHGVNDSNFVDVDGTMHFNGYTFSPEALSSISNLDLSDVKWSNKLAILSVSALENAQSDFEIYYAACCENYEHLYVEGLQNWNNLDAVGGLFLPLDSVNAIADWLVRA